MQKLIKRASHKRSGYSLLEISIVMLIVGVAGGFSLSTGYEQYRIQQALNSWNELQQIRRALQFYGQTQGSLPCPAQLTLTITDANYGAATTDDCSDATPPAGVTRVEYPASSGEYVRIGAVPVHALGLDRDLMTDEWGNFYFYGVSESNTALLDAATEGVIGIQDTSGNNITTTASYVIGTYGPSEKGATTEDTNTVLIACDNADLDSENCDGDGLFFDGSYNEDAAPANFFDDYILWGTNGSTLKEQASIVNGATCTANGASCSASGDCCAGSFCDAGSGSTCQPEYDCILNGFEGPASGAETAADCYFTCASNQESTSYGNVTYSGTPVQANSLNLCTFDCATMDAACSGGSVTDESACSCPTYDCVANGYDGPVALQNSAATCYYTCASHQESTSYGNVTYSGTPTQDNSLNNCTFSCTDMDASCSAGQVTDESSCSCVTTCDVFVHYDLDNDAHEFNVALTKYSDGSSVYSQAWTSSNDYDVGVSSAITIDPDTDYLFVINAEDGPSDTLDGSSDYIGLSDSSGTAEADKILWVYGAKSSSANQFESRAKVFRVNSSCQLDTSTYCPVEFHSDLDSSASSYDFELNSSGGAQLAFESLGFSDTSAGKKGDTIYVPPSSTLDFRIYDTARNGFANVNEYMALTKGPYTTSSNRIAVETGDTDNWGLCAKAVNVSSSCTYSGDTSMNCITNCAGECGNAPASDDFQLWCDCWSQGYTCSCFATLRRASDGSSVTTASWTGPPGGSGGTSVNNVANGCYYWELSGNGDGASASLNGACNAWLSDSEYFCLEDGYMTCSQMWSSCSPTSCTCRAVGESCAVDANCCGGNSCVGLQCACPLTADGGSCTVDGDCCSGSCTSGTCDTTVNCTVHAHWNLDNDAHEFNIDVSPSGGGASVYSNAWTSSNDYDIGSASMTLTAGTEYIWTLVQEDSADALDGSSDYIGLSTNSDQSVTADRISWATGAKSTYADIGTTYNFTLDSSCNLQEYDCTGNGYDGPASGAYSASECYNNCSVYVYYDLDNDAHEFNWALKDGGTTLQSTAWTSSDDYAIGNTGPYTIQSGKTYTFEVDYEDTADGLDSSSDYISITTGPYTTSSNRIARTTGTTDYDLCTKDFTLPSNCAAPSGSSMSCTTAAPACTADYGICSTHLECCSGFCDLGNCAPSGGGCPGCSSHAECDAISPGSWCDGCQCRCAMC